MESGGWYTNDVTAAHARTCVHCHWRSAAKAATGSLRRNAAGYVEEHHRSGWDLPQTCSLPLPCFWRAKVVVCFCDLPAGWAHVHAPRWKFVGRRERPCRAKWALTICLWALRLASSEGSLKAKGFQLREPLSTTVPSRHGRGYKSTTST